MSVFKILNLNNAQIGIWKLDDDIETLKLLIFRELDKDEKEAFLKFKSERRQKEWLAVRALLQHIKQKYSEPIKYSNTCKPFLNSEKISISHSHNFAAIILSETADVSIDIEKISNKPQKIAHKFLSKKEISDFDISNPQIATLLWSAKESVYKIYSQKQLAFIDNIKLHQTEIKNNGTIKATLLQNTDLQVNYEFIENNVLTYIINTGFNFSIFTSL